MAGTSVEVRSAGMCRWQMPRPCFAPLPAIATPDRRSAWWRRGGLAGAGIRSVLSAFSRATRTGGDASEGSAFPLTPASPLGQSELRLNQSPDSERLAVGRRKLEVRVERTDSTGARVSLSIDGVAVGEGRIPNLLRILSSSGMDLGRSLSPVNTDYTAPFVYPGRIHSIEFELPAAPQQQEVAAEAEAQARVAMTRQ
jgi:hypothetical protein